MAVLGNTSGHLQLGQERILQLFIFIIATCAPVRNLDIIILHHLLVKITFVSQGMCSQAIMARGRDSTAMTLSGMVRTVTPPVHVAPSTIPHTLPNLSARQLPMTSS